MRQFWIILAVGVPLLCGAARPNIVWIMTEDNSKHYLRLFDETHGAASPTLERIAKEGLVFERAFSCGAVCSVARTTLITSCYAPRVGTQYHRRLSLVGMPEDLQPFPVYLGKAGYHLTNVSKTDYNIRVEKSFWDKPQNKQAAWRGRKEGQPFFHVRTFTDSHEGSLHVGMSELDKTTTVPESVTLLACYPDTPVFRKTAARYHDRMKANDQKIQSVLTELRKDGILEDTFIFVFGDHGGVLPRGKGYLYDTGVHVPLVVRIPENFKDMVDGKRGDRVKGFVNFTDFGPTVLRLAGVEVPTGVDGKPFLGAGVSMAEVNARDEAFSYADRFDEKYETIRAFRKGRYKYMRYYEGFYPDGLQNNYRYRMLAYKEWRQLHQDGKLDERSALFHSAKPAEALYDLESDPAEVKNLANDPAHHEMLLKLRAGLVKQMKALPDLSMYPERVMLAKGIHDPAAFGQTRKEHIATLIDAADLALLPLEQALPELKDSLASADPWVRYWALIACSHFGTKAEGLKKEVEACLTSDEPLVRMRAAEYLGMAGLADPQPVYKELLRTSQSGPETLLILNSLVYLRDGIDRGYTFGFTKKDVAQTGGGEIPRRIQYLGW